ncbi:MAG: hypothetical protein R3F37_08770 [Candidatus Competibacteraceae bacterium]
MKRFVPVSFLLCLLMLLLGAQALHAEQNKDSLFINLTNDDIWRASMALGMAEQIWTPVIRSLFFSMLPGLDWR